MRAAKMKAGCYQGGGAVRSPEKMRVARATGGRVANDEMPTEGMKAKPRLDKAPRGKKVEPKGKGHTNVNVIVAPKDNAPAMPPAPPMAGPPMPPRPPMAPPGMPMRARGGRVTKHDDEAQDRKLIKSMLKEEERKENKRASGGRVKRADGGEVGESVARKPHYPLNTYRGSVPRMQTASDEVDGALDRQKKSDDAMRYAKGGRVHMTAGAESGEGRLQKIKLQKRAG